MVNKGVMVNKHKIVGLLVAVFLSAILCAYAAEEITITTYYPSPQGVYKTLKAKRMAIGDQFFQGNWPDQGGTIDSVADLVVQGEVGIGTTTPGGLLDVSSNTTSIYGINMTHTNTDTAFSTWKLWNMNSTYGYGFHIWEYPLAGGSKYRFSLMPNGDTHLSPTGNVSIGRTYTDDPSAKLDILTATSLDGIKVSDGTHWVKLVSGTTSLGSWNPLVSAGDNALIYSASSSVPGSASSTFVIAPWASATSGLRVSNEGKVSIGTKNVYASLLNVGGGIRVMKGQPGSADNSNAGYTFQADGDTGMFAAGGDDSQNSEIQFYCDGNLGISFMEGTVKMLAWGGAAKTAGGNVWEVWSDQRLKKNISAISGALSKLLQLRGKYFEWSEPGNAKIEPGVQMGFIAQDVEKVFPDWVHESKDGIKTVGLKGLDALVVESFREINERLLVLERENGELKQKIKDLTHERR